MDTNIILASGTYDTLPGLPGTSTVPEGQQDPTAGLPLPGGGTTLPNGGGKPKVSVNDTVDTHLCFTTDGSALPIGYYRDRYDLNSLGADPCQCCGSTYYPEGSVFPRINLSACVDCAIQVGRHSAINVALFMVVLAGIYLLFRPEINQVVSSKAAQALLA